MMRREGDPLIIAIVGAESTGKTTLARDLAQALDVPWLPEVARGYLERHGPDYDADDVRAIARGQRAAEHELLAESDAAVLDTDLTVIKVWWQVRYGELDPFIADALTRQAPRRYLLTCPDLPWSPDPLREHPHAREALHARYQAELSSRRETFAEIRGTGRARLAAALRVVRAWRANA